MQDNFESAINLVLKHEGGYSNHPSDPGGRTKYGITQNTLRLVNPKIDIRNISKKEAKNIYKTLYADKIKFNKLDNGYDYALLDFAINSGTSRAIKSAQKCCNVTADGIIGNITIDAINSNPLFITDLCSYRQSFLQRLKTFRTFGRGWTARVRDVQINAWQMRING